MAQRVSALGNAAECAVCMIALSPKDIFYTPCSHAFHHACIITWITERSTTCPNCRQTVLPMQIRRLHVTLTDDTTVEKEIAVHKARIATLESENVYLRGMNEKWGSFSEKQDIKIAKTSSLLSATQEELAGERLDHAETTRKFELELAAERERNVLAAKAWGIKSVESRNYRERAEKLQMELGVERGKNESASIAWQLKFDVERQKYEETAKKLQMELSAARNEHAKQAEESKERLAAAHQKYEEATKEFTMELARKRQQHSETVKNCRMLLAAIRQQSRKAKKELEKELAALRQKYEETEKELKKVLAAGREKHGETGEKLEMELAAESEQNGGTAEGLEKEKAQLVRSKEASSDARRVDQQRIEKPTKQLSSTKKAKLSHPAKARPPDFDGIAARTRSQTRMMR